MTTYSSGSTMLVYAITGAVFSFGLFLLIYSLYGKRIDDHPWCRKCKFDLFGLDTESTKSCPECGYDLTKPKAVRVGQRKKRRRLLFVSTLVLFLGMSSMGVKIYTDVAGVNWQHHKPFWLLLREANGTPGNGTSDDALFELRRRYDAGLLSGQQTDDIIETALTHQADTQRPWQPAWGNFIQQGRKDGVVSQDQWVRYAEGILVAPHRLIVRPEIAMGTDRLAIKLEDRNVRMGDGNQEFWLEMVSRSVMIGPKVGLRIGMTGGSLIGWSNQGSRTANLNINKEDWAKLEPGQYKVVYEYVVALYEDANQSNDPSLALADNLIQLETTIEVLSEERSTVVVIKNEDYRQAVEKAVRLNQPIQSNPPDKNSRTGNHLLEFRFAIDQLVFPIAKTKSSQTIDLACDIVVRHEGIEYTVGSMTFAGDNDSTGLGMFGNLKIDLRGKSIDLILRPSVEKAEDSIDCHEIWGEEIIFKNVEVK